MNSRLSDWIWHIRGSVALAPEQSSDEVFDKLDPLFQETGTHHERAADTLTFRKKDQAAQDKMSIIDHGVLRIERGATGSVLRYHLTSRMLLFCFLAPFMFLAFAQLTVAIGKYEQASAKAAGKSDDAALKKKQAKMDADVPLHPIDKALGAPEPEKAKKDGEGEKDDKKHSPTAAYVLAAIFATLYVVGRILEDRLIHALFRKRLRDAAGNTRPGITATA